jgi:outer membrane receptor protein involved in Fe transport
MDCIPLLLAALALQTQSASPPGKTPLPTVHEEATVTATRSSVELGATANTVSTLSAHELTQYPALTLDERLRQHAGFELFRRSSSWVANPTSEGISLRELGSTAASRTLVLSSGVPLNDPFGGWIHWDEQPPQTIEAVTLASGGGSDLYGSSALGGVIDVIPAVPGANLFEADLAGASEDTSNLSGRADRKQARWDELVAAQSFRTDGYITTAPAVRGAVDIPSNVHFENGRIEIDRELPNAQRAFLVGNLMNEARDNGTPLQTNGTRLWREIAGDDWIANDRLSGRVRAFASDEAYRQTFSSINANRSAETLTRLQRVETQEFGASTDAAYHRSHVALIAGGDLRDIRATDNETPIAAGRPSGLADTSARQRFFGAFGEALAERGPWSGAASLRGDDAANLTTRVLAQTDPAPATLTPLPDRRETIVSPRLGLARRLPGGVSLHASGFRAFRTPTMNELYRTGQVGQQTTLANSSLVSERATGAEGGANWASPRNGFAAQATYFWTEINRPVSAVTLSTTPTSTLLKRENLGQIQSQGVELAAQVQPAHTLSADFGYEYAHAVVTNFSAQPALVGLWIPEVPRHTATAQLRYHPIARTFFTLAAREMGHAFDDSSNLYKLHGFFVLDAYAESRVNAHLSAYVSFQNLLNRAIETARTPNLTLGTPFTAQGGVRVSFGARRKAP